jgi:sec-independent protein translocase protein TatB
MLSIPHLVIIFIVVLVVFGPEKIPELARNFGKVMAEFRRVTGDLRSTFEGHLRDLEREADQRRAAPPVPAAVAEAAPASGAAPPAPAVAVAGAESGTPPQPAPPAPGTVPSNPPNASAIATPSAPLNNPADPMHDPYLMSMDFPTPDSPAAPEPTPQSEQKPERVIDGHGRSS